MLSGKEETEPQLEQLYRAAKDENELLEFKNYELLFKIQELEQSLATAAGDKQRPKSQTEASQPSLPESISTAFQVDRAADSHKQQQNETLRSGVHGEQVCWLSESPVAGYWSDSELPPSTITGANGGEHHHHIDKVLCSWSGRRMARRQIKPMHAQTGRHSTGGYESPFPGSSLLDDGSRKVNRWRQEICSSHDSGAGQAVESISNDNNHNKEQVEAKAVKVGLGRRPLGSIPCLGQLGSPEPASESSFCDTPDTNQQSSEQPKARRTNLLLPEDMPSSNTNRSLLMRKPAGAVNWRNSATPVLRRAYAKLQQPSATQRTVLRSTSNLENMTPEATAKSSAAATPPPITTGDTRPPSTGVQSNFGFRLHLSGRQRAKSISNLSSSSSSTTSSTSSNQNNSSSSMNQFVTKIPSLISQSRGDTSSRLAPSKRACSRSYSSLISADERQQQQQQQQQKMASGRLIGGGSIQLVGHSGQSTELMRISQELVNESELAGNKKCAQCSGWEAKVATLTAERQQLRDQISELEELENDSRLMSQKLAQQLAEIGRKLAECKLELEKTCENKSKLQFQNKRLSFELKQRLESIEQLQCQLTKLQTKASLKHQLQLNKQECVQKTEGLAGVEKGFRSWPLSGSAQSDEDDSSSSASYCSPKDAGSGSVKSESCQDSAYAHSAAGDSHSEANSEADNGQRCSSPRSVKTSDDRACAVSSISSSSFSSSSADESDHRTEHNSGEQMLLVAGARQQVLHKKISTAKILRGSQVPATNNRSSLPAVSSTGLLDTPSGLLNQVARPARVVSAEEGEDLQADQVDACNEHPSASSDGRSRDSTETPTIERDARGSQELEPEAERCQSAAAIKRLEQEIAGLRTRLMQAHTLNDNLVSELGSNKKQHQLERQVKASSLVNGCGCTCAAEAAAAAASSGTQQPSIGGAKRSIVYLNSGGSLRQVAGNEQHGSRSFLQPVLDWQGDQKQRQQQQPKPDQTACELLEFLRFLLDKMHFHHGRNLELVNENQRLAMNALVASNNQRLNSISNTVSTTTTPTTGHHLIPLRPPPRRRNRMQSGSAEQLPSSTVLNTVVPTHKHSPQSATTSALQVAKQTLLSIVPIYHNNNSNNNNGPNQAASENNKQKQELTSDDNNNNNNLDNTSTENNHTRSSSIKRSSQPSQLSAPPNGWIVLNQSAASNKCNQLEALPGHLYANQQQVAPSQQHHHHQLQPNRQHNNVSVLHINRSPPGSDASLMESMNGFHHQMNSNQQHCHPLAPAAGSTFDGQQFIKVHNLPLGTHNYDLERYKALFSVQLMDLLTRQQWCENIISEKLRSVEQRQQQHSLYFASDNSNNKMQQHHLYLDAKLTASATSSVNLTSSISTQQQQQVVTHNRSWTLRDQVASSFC